MWIELLFIWIEDVFFKLPVEMSQSGLSCQQTFFCLFEAFSIIIISKIIGYYSTNNIQEDRVTKCRKIAIRLLRPNTKPYSITLFPSRLLPHPQIHTFQKNCHFQNQ